MKTTKIIIKTLSELLPQLTKETDYDKFIFNRVEFYLSLIKANKDDRERVKYMFGDLFDYHKDAYNHFFGEVDLNQNPNWMKVWDVYDYIYSK